MQKIKVHQCLTCPLKDTGQQLELKVEPSWFWNGEWHRWFWQGQQWVKVGSLILGTLFCCCSSWMGDALFHCTCNNIFHIILLSPGKATHFVENTTVLKACEHWIFLLTHKVVVCRCGEQLGSDICGQDTSPSAASDICHCHICSGPHGPSQSRELRTCWDEEMTDPGYPNPRNPFWWWNTS